MQINVFFGDGRKNPTDIRRSRMGAPTQMSFGSNSNGGIRLAAPMVDHAILRPPAFRAYFPNRANRIISMGIEDAVKTIISKEKRKHAPWKNRRLPFSDFIDHVR